ncbi:hypothetical protein E2C01_030605 [Portunus trituberculatus]|uniref:Uncharacterized protein n=1 Tax=Portunus trituberculatus TaxID=210409 RepID=A0A5B7ER95_PORTR|nr:hypothetical protein [Portunus trituberculatus]
MSRPRTCSSSSPSSASCDILQYSIYSSN